MELSPCWEATGCAVTQEFTNILWNPVMVNFNTVFYKLAACLSLPYLCVAAQVAKTDRFHSTLTLIFSNSSLSSHVLSFYHSFQPKLSDCNFEYGYPTEASRTVRFARFNLMNYIISFMLKMSHLNHKKD
jgi:hypothetical protein